MCALCRRKDLSLPKLVLMYEIGECIKVLSANCQGLRDYKKSIDVLDYFKKHNPNILCLQDTHLLEKDKMRVNEHWDGECILHGSRTNARGVGILLRNNFEHEL